MKALLFFAMMGVGAAAVASDEVYDYQGRVMMGAGGFETFTAQIEYFGPFGNPLTAAEVTISYSGTYSGSYSIGPCPINTCESAETPLLTTVSEKNGQFAGAEISGWNFTGKPGSIATVGFDIGKSGDSFDLEIPGGATLLSVSNSTPGLWTVTAPEFRIDGAISAMTLLGACLLMCGDKAPRTRRRPAPG